MWRWIVCALMLVLTCCAETPRGGGADGVVVLDIGHFVESPGAQMPSALNGERINECAFWYRYAAEVKKAVTEAGYPCVIINRGNAPTTEPLATYARRARVLHLRHPDVKAARYPSHYFPDRVASGIVCADYAVWCKASCVVFLHHNSTVNRWVTTPMPSVVLCNKYNGHVLAQTLCDVLNAEVINHGMDNGGRQCTVLERSVDADRAAGWMNVCDDAGIPAAVIEAAFLNNRAHATYLLNDANARKYAQTVGQGIVRYLREHGHDKRHYRENPDEPDQGSFGYAEESRRLKVPGAKCLLHTPRP